MSKINKVKCQMSKINKFNFDGAYLRSSSGHFLLSSHQLTAFVTLFGKEIRWFAEKCFFTFQETT